ncbi:MAG: hypothetical protein ACRD19_09210 [Terriglobia bacterium]
MIATFAAENSTAPLLKKSEERTCNSPEHRNPQEYRISFLSDSNAVVPGSIENAVEHLLEPEILFI